MSTYEAHQARDDEKIRRGAQARGGRPATVKGTAEGAEAAGLLRIASDDDAKLKTIEWEEFFNKFDEEGLAFLYQKKPRTVSRAASSSSSRHSR